MVVSRLITFERLTSNSLLWPVHLPTSTFPHPRRSPLSFLCTPPVIQDSPVYIAEGSTTVLCTNNHNHRAAAPATFPMLDWTRYQEADQRLLTPCAHWSSQPHFNTLSSPLTATFSNGALDSLGDMAYCCVRRASGSGPRSIHCGISSGGSQNPWHCCGPSLE